MKTPALNISLITENDLCISCGACKHACPSEVVSISMNERKGLYEPLVSDPAACLNCTEKPCLKVCPSYEENFFDLAGWKNELQEIGPFHSLYTGFSSNLDTHKRASSGGIIRELSAYFLEQNLADAILTLKHKSALDYEPALYSTTDEFSEMPGSIYHNINFENAIEILKTVKARVVLIATPCQLTSIKKWELECAEQKSAKIVCSIGLICGWMFSRHSLSHFAKSQSIPLTAIEDVAYRGGDKIGSLTIRTSQETFSFSRRPKAVRDKYFSSYRTAFSTSYNTRRCLLCAEHLNYLSDIAVGDAWLDAFKTEKKGISLVIVRNPSMDSVVQRLKGEGRIQVSEATESDVMESQSRDLAMGISAKKLMNKMRQSHQFSPNVMTPIAVKTMPSWRLRFKKEIFPRFCRFLNGTEWGYMFFCLRRPVVLLRHSFYMAGRIFLLSFPLGRKFHGIIKRKLTA